MNMFRVNVTIISMIFCIITSSLSAWSDEPTSVMPAYENRISQVAYAIGSHDQHAITFVCQRQPICIYTPLSYEESQLDSTRKTYFLPRTQSVDSKTRYFYADLQKSLKLLGIDLHIKQINDVHYGLQLTFTMQSKDAYDIVKVVDIDKNLIHFNIIAKI